MLDAWMTAHPLPPVAALILGALLLFAGRRLFWFAVGAAGFLAGFYLAWVYLGPDPWWLALGAGLLLGLAGAVLAALVQRLAVGLFGFVVGGAGAAAIAEQAFGLTQPASWVVFVVAGIVAAILAGMLFEAALIVLSSFLGAGLVVDALDAPAGQASLVFVILFALGLLAQAFTRPRGDRREQQQRRRRRDD